MPETRAFSLVKPTTHTPFHIDFAWWKEYDNNWRVFLHDFLCPEHQAMFSTQDGDLLIDHVDPVTAEIHQVDGLQQKLMTHCSKQEGFVSTTHSLVDNVFRIFLSNGNNPLTPEELAELTGKSGDTILRLLSGTRVFMGIRPCHM
jgi:hypothetical protein